MARKSIRWDAAGWPFWTLVFGLLLAPCIYFSFQIVIEGTSFLFPVGMGVIGSALGAGFIAWGVNSALQFVQKQKRKAAKKKPRKK